jgi:mono/diheme cytochrome c family protein
MRILKYIAGLILVVAVAAAGVLAWAASWPAVAPIDPPERGSFDSALVDKGETLAALGDCVVCHTAEDGEPYAGGRPLPTPFGVIHATNITPDPETGIGRWSEEAFRRALRRGVDRAGNHLYPAFPYNHFTRLTDDDIAALYAYLMTRAPAAAETPANSLAFPYNIRLLMAGWNLLYLHAGAHQPDPARDAEWNRGAYLVEGIGHCGACHTPRNALGAEKADAPLAGGEVEGWHAFALDASSQAPVPWDADAIVNYLLDGWDANHGVAAGPMTPVVDGLAAISEDDAYAIAAYVLSFQTGDGGGDEAEQARDFAAARAFGGGETPAGGPTPPAGADPAFGRGLAVFARVCANCHRANAQAAPLALVSTVTGPDPRNFLHIVVDGIRPPEAAFDRSMPGFGGSLGDADLVDLATFVRAHFSEQPAWGELEAKVREVRGGG